jgi:hypothetical protein
MASVDMVRMTPGRQRLTFMVHSEEGLVGPGKQMSDPQDQRVPPGRQGCG